MVYLGSQAIAEMDGNGTHELHSDHLGTPRVITTASNGTSVIEGRQNYGPYGETFPVQDSGYTPLTGYTGHLQTDPTGLIYMCGRFYTPIWHRFVNSDQGADPSTWNQMAYVGGSPMMAIDPSGMEEARYTCVNGYYQDQHGRRLKDVTGKDVPCSGVVGGGGGGGQASGGDPIGGGVLSSNGSEHGGGGGGMPPPPTKKEKDCLDAALKAATSQLEAAKSQLDQVVNRSNFDVWSQNANDSVSFGQSAEVGGTGFLASEYAASHAARTGSLAIPSGIGGWTMRSGRGLGYLGAAMLVGQVWSGTIGVYYHNASDIPDALSAFNSRSDEIMRDFKKAIGGCK